MTALSTFRFLRYTLRPADRSDLPLAKEWNDLDPDHAGRVDPEFWIWQGGIHRGTKEDAYVLVDKKDRLFFLKMTSSEESRTTVELHIQFDPETTAEAKVRRAEALKEGLYWLEASLAISGVEEIVFRSRNPALILFSVRRLGFTSFPANESGETILRKKLPRSIGSEGSAPDVRGHVAAKAAGE